MARYTFLLPAYKGQFLDEMLNSIQSQSYKDYRVIISDDCSPDDIISICSPYLLDRRFVYRKNEKNLGSTSLVSHWNLLIDMCETEYLIIASDDDVYDMKFLEEVDRLTEQYPNVDLLRARTRRINGKGEPYVQDYICDELETPLQFIYSSFSQDRIHCIGNYVFKTKALKSMGNFIDFPLAWFSDDATVFSCALEGVANTRKILFNFRSSDINISNSFKINPKEAQAKIDASCLFYEWMNTFVNRIHYQDSLLDKMLYNGICKGYKDRVKWQIFSYYRQIKLKAMINMMLWAKNRHLISNRELFGYIKSWFIYQIKK